MEKSVPLYNQISNKIVNRILTGLYPNGYLLSSMQKIHEEYDIGYTSIRRAMHLLQQENFIQLEERKRPRVIFDIQNPQCRELQRRVFLSRCQSHLDCYRALPCLLPSLLMLGARHCTPHLLDTLDELCAQPETHFSTRNDLLILIYTWQMQVIRQAENELASDLFIQIRGFDDLRFIVMPSEKLVPGEARMTMQYLRYWTELLRRGDLESLHTLVSLFCQQAMYGLNRSFQPLMSSEEMQQVQQVEFNWYVHQVPTPLYKKIAFDLLRTVHLDGMQPGSYFPPESVLMEQYGVATITVRGALALLNELGIAQTVNGVGTFFTGTCAPAPEIRPCIRECCESLDILAGLGQALSNAAAPLLSKTDIEMLRTGADQYRTRGGLVLWMLRQFVSTLSIHALENVFEQLETRYIFGLYASGLSVNDFQPTEHTHRRVISCLALLETGDSETFSSQFGLLCQELGLELHRQLEAKKDSFNIR